jgi:pyruvate-formate lyase-activating enzyme
VKLASACRNADVTLVLDPDTPIPPCLFPANTRPAGLFALSPGGARRDDCRKVEACADCLLRDRCPGVPRPALERFGVPELHPIREERARRRLTLTSSVDEQIERELVTTNLYRADDGSQGLEAIVRVNFQCNQSCAFCFVSTHLPAAPHERVEEVIRRASADGARIVLSGGEPTLNPRLCEYVALARSLSRLPVEVQTNAVRLDDERLVRGLVEAGLERAFVSLHGSTAATSDTVTGAPGTFERSVRGIDQLSRAGVAVVLNFVICRANFEDLPDYVRLVAERWPRALVNVSFVAPSSDLVPRDRALIPRYGEVFPALARALGEAERLGVRVTGFDSMCGIPFCLLPSSLERYLRFSELPPGLDGGEFVKPAACGTCALSTRCFGLRRGYAELYGADELRPVSEAAPVALS